MRLLHLGAIATLVWTQNIAAHHSYAEYDDQRIVEIEGTLVDVAWQNPHSRFAVEGIGADGRAVTWDIEGIGLNNTLRMQVPLDIVKVGGKVKFAGWPSKRAANRLYANNLLAPDGREVVLWRLGKPRWTRAALGIGSEQSAAQFQGGVASGTNSLFRVWATDYDDLASYVPAITTPLPLTEVARKAEAAFDPVTDTVTPGCTPKGMPLVMLQPPPLEFIDRGDTILLRTEEYDSVRTIHMKASAAAAGQPKSPLGYSTGRWEGATLLVETSRVNAPYLSPRGAPLGTSARFVERFTPSADGSRLDYSLTIVDPDSLTEPAERKRYWVSRPGETVLPFNCGQRATSTP